MAHAEADYRDVVRDSEGQIVHLENGTCVRTKWLTDRDACAPMQRIAQQSIRRAQTSSVSSDLSQEDRTVYFKFNRADLSAEAQQRLDTLARVLKSNERVKEAKIVGYADRIGSVAYNQKLSEKRAETVRGYLISKGYTNANVTETRWVGKSEPSTNCPVMNNRSQLIKCLHNDRRVEVEVEYVNQGQIPNAR
jgi:outer membrane protein OmpA-like peptidoglycan-associated protein